MNDTSATARDVQRTLLMQRSGAERLKMGCAMFDAARRLMRAGLGESGGPDGSPALRARVFERTYGRDFDRATAARIVAHLLAARPGPR